jgi:hypothetical protein
MIGPVPCSFGITPMVSFYVDYYINPCVSGKNFKVGLLPGVTLGVTGHGAVDIFIAKAGVKLILTMNAELDPNFEVSGKQCNICVKLDLRLKPITIEVKLFAAIDIKIFKKEFNFKIFSWSAPQITKNLFKVCMPIPFVKKPAAIT